MRQKLQRLLISSGAIPELEAQFQTYEIDLGGRLTFNGTPERRAERPNCQRSSLSSPR
jgi:hypothetical protein